MPHWVSLVAIVAAAWLVLAVAGGWLIGRGLGVIERRSEGGEEPEAEERARSDSLRRAA